MASRHNLLKEPAVNLLLTDVKANKLKKVAKPIDKENNLKDFVILYSVSKKPESHMTALEKMDLVREGISKKDLENFKKKAFLDYDKLAHALTVTRATLINKDKNEKFGSNISEKIIGLADIYSYGYEVFENEEKFNQWMFQPNQALAGNFPYNLINNQFGREEVRNLIGRIDYGIYS